MSKIRSKNFQFCATDKPGSMELSMVKEWITLKCVGPGKPNKSQAVRELIFADLAKMKGE